YGGSMAHEAEFDCGIVGHGIVGLAHALAASKLGLPTAVLDRDARAAGASVRNFGFITVTGQEQGLTWRRAMSSRDVWAELAELAGIAVHHRGLLMCARRAEAMAVLEEFAGSDMGRACRLLDRAALAASAPMLAGELQGGLYSPHE